MKSILLLVGLAAGSVSARAESVRVYAPAAAVTSGISDGAVTTPKLADGSVTQAKLAAGVTAEGNTYTSSKTFTNGSFNIGVTTFNTVGGNVGIGMTNQLARLGVSKTANDTVSYANCASWIGDRTLDAGVCIQQTLSAPYTLHLQAMDSGSNAQPLALNKSGGNTSIGLGGTPLSLISTGTYTPTLTNTTNLDATTSGVAQFLRIGNIVTVWGAFSADPNTTLTVTVMGLSLPIASDLTSFRQLGGSGGNGQSATAIDGALYIGGDATNDRADVEWVPVSTTNKIYTFNFTYSIQ